MKEAVNMSPPRLLSQNAVKDIRENHIPYKVPFRIFAKKYGITELAVYKVFHGLTYKESYQDRCRTCGREFRSEET